MLPFFLGARHGLSLVLNIEQYEHIEGASRDAGVKVTLLSLLEVMYTVRV